MEDTRQKELFYFQTLPSTSVDFFFSKFLFLSRSQIMCLSRKRLRAIKKNQIAPSL